MEHTLDFNDVLIRPKHSVLGEHAVNSGALKCILALVLPALLLAASGASSGDDKANSGTQKRYSSPKAIFEAYREARVKRDARKLFNLFTTKIQDHMVFESFFSCMERQGADAITGHGSESGQIGRLVDKYVDVATLDSDYEKQYKKKHGIDLAKVFAEHQHEQGFVPPPHDEQLYRDVVALHVKDKVGFVEAVGKYFDERAAKRQETTPVWPLGDLENLVVQSNTATGRAKMTILPRAGEKQKKPGQSPPIYEKPFEFRRINGGWLIDSP